MNRWVSPEKVRVVDFILVSLKLYVVRSDGDVKVLHTQIIQPGTTDQMLLLNSFKLKNYDRDTPLTNGKFVSNSVKVVFLSK